MHRAFRRFKWIGALIVTVSSLSLAMVFQQPAQLLGQPSSDPPSSQPSAPGADNAGIEELSTAQLGQSLAQLQQNYQALRKTYQRVALYNEEYCKEAATLARACPLSLPISSKFFSPGICTANGFGTYPVTATVSGGGRWKLRINQIYNSSAFSGADSTTLTFTKTGINPHAADHQRFEFFLPFKKITTLELLAQGSSASPATAPTLTLAAGEHLVAQSLRLTPVVGGGDDNEIWRADLAEFEAIKHQPDCQPVFETIRSRVSAKVDERLQALSP